MSARIVVFVINAKKGKTENWIVFEANVSRFDVNRKYIIDFCGTEVDSDIPLTDGQNEILKELLVKDFGYAPYNIEKAKKIIGMGKQYFINK